MFPREAKRSRAYSWGQEAGRSSPDCFTQHVLDIWIYIPVNLVTRTSRMLKIAMNTDTTIKRMFESARNNKGLPSFNTKYMI